MTPVLETPPRRRWLFLAVAALALLAYYPTLRVGFLWDDQYAIELNPRIRTWDWKGIQSDFTSGLFHNPKTDLYRPLETLLNRVDYTLWGLRPAGFHLTNLLLHAASSMAVMAVAITLGTGLLPAFLGAALFAVHPIIVQDMLVVVGRDEPLSFLLMMVAALGLMQARRWAMVGGVAAFAMSLFAKESAIVFPALLALLFWAQERPRRDYARLVPLVLVAAAYLAIFWVVMKDATPALEPARTLSFLWTDFPSVLGRYVLLVFSPWPLYTDRAVPAFSIAERLGWGVVWVAAIVVFWYRRSRWHWVAAAWIVILLAPKAIKMAGGHLMLDHWMYPALPAILVPLGWSLARAWQDADPRVRFVGRTTFAVLAVAWMFVVHANVLLRGTDVGFYRWSVRFPTSLTMKQGLGVALAKERNPEAIQVFRDIAKRMPDDDNANAQLGLVLWQFGRREETLATFRAFMAAHADASATRDALARVTASQK